MPMIEFKLPCYRMHVTVEKNGGGYIESDLTLGGIEDFAEVNEDLSDNSIASLYAAYNAIESMVLACACEGYAIDAPAFVRAIATAVEACTNKLS